MKGNLKKHLPFWEKTIRANETVCNILKSGYKLPFLCTPSNAEFKNNSSALKNWEFIEESIKDMLRVGTVKERLTKPKVLNPLSVSTKGKERLILDLRYVNNHLSKNKIKFDDWNSFQNYLEGHKGHLFKFDLKSGYHHVGIFQEHQTYLGFSWEINQQIYCFVFNVLPFGLSTAPFVFIKAVRPLTKHWHLHAIRTACFLGDSLGIEFGYSKSETSSKFFLNTLINTGFIINKEKSVWEPTKTLTWLGISVNLNKGCLYVSKEPISNLLETVEYITNHPYVSARTLAKFAGKIISTKFVLGDITLLKTRFIYQCIESRVSWDKKFNINNYNKMVEEIVFWKFNKSK